MNRKKQDKKKSPQNKGLDLEPVTARYDATRIKKISLAIFIITCIAFIPSLLNDYALDDFIVIVKNKFTQRGFAGITDILSRDTFAGMTEDNIMVLSGGRYRPLSVVTFAMEQSLFGDNPAISHFINLVLNALNGILLFRLLLAFRTKIAAPHWLVISGCIALLYSLHPSHAESVINIKGRDDLLCLTFFLLGSIHLFKWSEKNSASFLAVSGLFYLLSLLSKESAITFVAVVPLFLYFFGNTEKKKIKIAGAVYLAIAVIALGIRQAAAGSDPKGITEEILNNPFLGANANEKFATLILIPLFYLKLLFYPYHLSYDYNYNQFPLTTFSDWQVWLSLVIHVCLFVYALKTFREKSIFSFSILFYFITFSIFSNFLFNIGTPFADRFMYLPSLGFCMALIALGYRIFKSRISGYMPYVLSTLLTIILISYLVRDFDRSFDWKDNNTLFLADVTSTPNSVKSQINASLAYIDLASGQTGQVKDSLLNKAIPHLEKAMNIFPEFVNSYLNMGVIYNWKGDFEQAEYWWKKAKEISPNNGKLKEYEKVLSTHYLNKGLKYGTEHKIDSAISSLLHALKYDSSNAELYYNLGGAYYTAQRYDSAGYFWQRSLQLNPADERTKQAIQALKNILRNAQRQ